MTDEKTGVCCNSKAVISQVLRRTKPPILLNGVTYLGTEHSSISRDILLCSVPILPILVENHVF